MLDSHSRLKEHNQAEPTCRLSYENFLAEEKGAVREGASALEKASIEGQKGSVGSVNRFGDR
jgi:hypothetical protein